MRTRIRAYASHWLGGCRTPEAVAEGTREALRRGFTAFKWSPLHDRDLRAGELAAIARAAELMAAARDAAGELAEIMLECAEWFTHRTAVLAARALAPYRPYWFEEPLPFENPKAMAQLKRELAVPLATGERLLSRWEFRELIESGGADVLQPDLIHAGGITEVKKIAALADTYYLPIAPHNSQRPHRQPALGAPRGDDPQLPHPGGDRAGDRAPRRHLHPPPEARGGPLPASGASPASARTSSSRCWKRTRTRTGSGPSRPATGPSRRAIDRLSEVDSHGGSWRWPVMAAETPFGHGAGMMTTGTPSRSSDARRLADRRPQHAQDVETEDLAHVVFGVAALDQAPGDQRHLGRVGQQRPAPIEVAA